MEGMTRGTVQAVGGDSEDINYIWFLSSLIFCSIVEMQFSRSYQGKRNFSY